MPTMVQIRNVPSELHRQLKSRAALEGISLSDFLLREIRQAMERPTLDEMRRRLAGRPPVRPENRWRRVSDVSNAENQNSNDQKLETMCMHEALLRDSDSSGQNQRPQGFPVPDQ